LRPRLHVASSRVREFLCIVTANNRPRGERADRNHLGIPFNRAASETNCGLTVYRLQPGQSGQQRLRGRRGEQSIGAGGTVKATVGRHEGWIRVRDYDLSEIGE